MRSFSRAVKAAVGTVGLVAALLGAMSAPANAETSVVKIGTTAATPSAGVAVDTLPDIGVNAVPVICFRGHVQDIGWQAWDCDNDGNRAFAGTTGQNRRLEAVQFVAYTTGGQTCARAHVQNIGWQREVCLVDGLVGEVGTTDESLRIEALVFGSTARATCTDGHVQNQGWMGNRCVNAGEGRILGTTDLGLRLEAVNAAILQ